MQWALRLKIELEHNDLIEKRNAALVLETAVPITLVTLAYETKVLVLDNLPYFVIAAAIAFYCIHIMFTERYSQQLAKLRGELEQMVLSLQRVRRRRERAEPKRTVLHLVMAGGEAVFLLSFFTANFFMFVVGFAVASLAALTVIYQQREIVSAAWKKVRERVSLRY